MKGMNINMIDIAYESFVNDICYNMAMEERNSFNNSISKLWSKVVFLWAQLIEFIRKKIDKFISFINKVLHRDSKTGGKELFRKYYTINGTQVMAMTTIPHISTDIMMKILNLKEKINSNDKNDLYFDIQNIEFNINDGLTARNGTCRDIYYCTEDQNNHLYEKWIVTDYQLKILIKKLKCSINQVTFVNKYISSVDISTFDNDSGAMDSYQRVLEKGAYLLRQLTEQLSEINNINQSTPDELKNLYRFNEAD